MDAHAANLIEQKLSERKSAHLEAQVEQHRDTINHLTERNNELTQSITQNLRRMRETRDVLDIAKAAADSDNFAEVLTQEWAQLREHPRLASASMDEDDNLLLTTTDDIRLHCEDRPDTRWLGAFEIEIGLEDGTFSLRNISNMRRGGRDHPHVVNGNPCFGSDAPIFAQLLSEGKLNVLYEMLLQYLEKCNLRDEYGRFAAWWFDRPDERPPEQTIPMEVAA